MEGRAGEAWGFPLPHQPEKLFLQELLGHQTRSGLFLCWMLVQARGQVAGSRGARSFPAGEGSVAVRLGQVRRRLGVRSAVAPDFGSGVLWRGECLLQSWHWRGRARCVRALNTPHASPMTTASINSLLLSLCVTFSMRHSHIHERTVATLVTAHVSEPWGLATSSKPSPVLPRLLWPAPDLGAFQTDLVIRVLRGWVGAG